MVRVFTSPTEIPDCRVHGNSSEKAPYGAFSFVVKPASASLAYDR